MNGSMVFVCQISNFNLPGQEGIRVQLNLEQMDLSNKWGPSGFGE